MQIFAVMMVRDEADLIEANLRYHLAAGIDRFLIFDNGSSDGTTSILEKLGCGGRVQWTSDAGDYYQSEITTELAREASLRGADWVIPIDADEFWLATRGDLRQVLEETSAGALRVDVVNFVQRREQRQALPQGLLHMTMRPIEPRGPVDCVQHLVESGEIPFVEMLYPPKWLSRASPLLDIGAGNHTVTGVAGPLEHTNRVVCLHAPLRAKSVLEAQAANGNRARAVGNKKLWHWLRWQTLAEQGRLEEEWRANSYANNCLDFRGKPRPLVFDPRLRDAVRAWIDNSSSPEDRHPSDVAAPALRTSVGTALRGHEIKNSALARMSRVEGWMAEDEAELLLLVVTLALLEHEDSAIVELGSYCGRSTVLLASLVEALLPETKVFAVDPHEGELTEEGGFAARQRISTFECFRRNVESAGVTDFVEPIRKRSYQVEWEQPIGLLFVDALHDYPNVSRDFKHFARWIVPGGYVAFHDCGEAFPDVGAFVDELVAQGEYRKLHYVRTLMVLYRFREGAGTPDSQSVPRDKHLRGGPRIMPDSDNDALREVVRAKGKNRSSETVLFERQAKAIAVIRSLVKDQVDREREQVRVRDQIIRDLQSELHSKVGEANEIVQDLQARLQSEVGTRDETIRELTAELHGKLGERDEIITGLRTKLQAAETNHQRTIGEQEARFAGQLEQRDKVIRALRSELKAVRGTRLWRLTELVWSFGRRVGSRLRRPPRKEVS